MRNILISTISFFNPIKEGSEIYTTYAKRLISDVLSKTPYDIMVTTNLPEDFNDDFIKESNRVIIREDKLETHKTHVGAFNQLLKFTAIKDIDEKYDWVLYLDCDAGFTMEIDCDSINMMMDTWEQQGYDMLALLTNRTYEWAENEYLENVKVNGYEKLFDAKFRFYGINPEWRQATLPSEHCLLIKNNDKLPIMCSEFEKFCYQFETQDPNYIITYDMEAFEIGISALIAGYVVGEMEWGRHCELFKIGYNSNNWEKIKR